MEECNRGLNESILGSVSLKQVMPIDELDSMDVTIFGGSHEAAEMVSFLQSNRPPPVEEEEVSTGTGMHMKWRAVFFGALQALLRECLSMGTDDLNPEVQQEMEDARGQLVARVHKWFADKQAEAAGRFPHGLDGPPDMDAMREGLLERIQQQESSKSQHTLAALREHGLQPEYSGRSASAPNLHSVGQSGDATEATTNQRARQRMRKKTLRGAYSYNALPSHPFSFAEFVGEPDEDVQQQRPTTVGGGSFNAHAAYALASGGGGGGGGYPPPARAQTAPGVASFKLRDLAASHKRRVAAGLAPPPKPEPSWQDVIKLASVSTVGASSSRPGALGEADVGSGVAATANKDLPSYKDFSAVRQGQLPEHAGISRRDVKATSQLLQRSVSEGNVARPEGMAYRRQMGGRAGTGTRFLHYEMETEAEFAMHDVWLQKRAEEAAEKHNQLQVHKALDEWAANRARVEGEILRRQESMRYASQSCWGRHPNHPSSKGQRQNVDDSLAVVGSGQEKGQLQRELISTEEKRRALQRGVVFQEEDAVETGTAGTEMDEKAPRGASGVAGGDGAGTTSPQKHRTPLNRNVTAPTVISVEKIGAGLQCGNASVDGTPLPMKFGYELPEGFAPSAKRSFDSPGAGAFPGPEDGSSTQQTSEQTAGVSADASGNGNQAFLSPYNPDRQSLGNGHIGDRRQTAPGDVHSELTSQRDMEAYLRVLGTGGRVSGLNPVHDAFELFRLHDHAARLSTRELNSRRMPDMPLGERMFTRALAKQPMAAKKGKKGKKGKKAAAAKGVGKNDKESGKKPEQPPLPTYASAQEFMQKKFPAYTHSSNTRRLQSSEVRRIRQAFQRAQMSDCIADGVLERALLIPQDKPEEACLANLQQQGGRLQENPLPKTTQRRPAAQSKKKKGKKKGKKKKA